MSGAAACLTASFLYGVLFVYASRYLTGRGLDPIVLAAGQLGAASGLSACALPGDVPGGCDNNPTRRHIRARQVR
ncbi:MAG: hypothetical protein JO287_00490 [Pseudonocardiales bacterium]|nr:hypothetical protein [Pseudonocardiales bacterium]